MGKGGASAPPPSGGGSNMDDQMMMMQILNSMTQMSQSYAPQAPVMPAAPDLETVKKVDWSDKQKELAKKAAIDFNDAARKRKGRQSTRHTSLVNEDEPKITGSILT